MIADCIGLGMSGDDEYLEDWRSMADRVDEFQEEVRIAMVGKYTGLSDSYLSVIKALQHSSIAVNLSLIHI